MKSTYFLNNILIIYFKFSSVTTYKPNLWKLGMRQYEHFAQYDN